MQLAVCVNKRGTADCSTPVHYNWNVMLTLGAKCCNRNILCAYRDWKRFERLKNKSFCLVGWCWSSLVRAVCWHIWNNSKILVAVKWLTGSRRVSTRSDGSGMPTRALLWVNDELFKLDFWGNGVFKSCFWPVLKAFSSFPSWHSFYCLRIRSPWSWLAPNTKAIVLHSPCFLFGWSLQAPCPCSSSSSSTSSTSWQ